LLILVVKERRLSMGVRCADSDNTPVKKLPCIHHIDSVEIPILSTLPPHCPDYGTGRSGRTGQMQRFRGASCQNWGGTAPIQVKFSTRDPIVNRHTLLITPSTALAAENSVKFVDCRASLADPDLGRRVYEAGHIAGAVYLSLDDDLAAPPGAGGRHPLPDPEILAARLRALGINDGDQVVVYDDAGGAFAARAWWCLRWLGHEAVAVLDGGLKDWPVPLSTETVTPAPGNFSIREPLTRTVDAATLAADLNAYTLVDARSEARFRGEEEPIDPVAGHIPGAICRPFQENLDDQGRFRAPRALAKRFPSGENTVCYCGSGVTAAHNVLAMRLAGLPEPLLYPGSWSEWILDEARPRAPADA
jgi:thiosulfate/3-mercaptopyruvate sulfurtransferase